MEATRRRLESTLRVDLSPVRVHSDKRTRVVVDRLHARAFTWGRRIFLGTGETATDVPLMAHEAAHVVQQRGRPVVQRSTGVPSPSSLEREAEGASAAAVRNEPAAVVGRTTGPLIQREERLGSIDQGPSREEESEGWLEGKIWGLLGSYANDLRAIARDGIVGWLRKRIVEGVQSLIDRIMAPVRAVGNVIKTITGTFGSLLDTMREVAAQIARNDCSSIKKAVERVGGILNDIMTAASDKIKGAMEKVSNFFSDLWNRFGAPIWETLKEIGGAVWEKIQQLGAWIWEKTQPVRDWLSRAWTWIKNKLGIGEGPEGQNGLLQWVKEKAAAAWDWVTEKLGPYKKQLAIIGGVLLLFTPAGPFVVFGAGVALVVKGVQWIKTAFATPSGPVDQRSFLQKTVIPALTKAADAVTGALKRVVSAVSDKLGGIVGSLAAAAGSLAGSVVSFLAKAVEWVNDQFKVLADWASGKLAALSDLISSGLERLKAFLQPILDFLAEVGGVIANVFKLPGMIIGKLWKLIPACIRDPFVNFLVEYVIKKIPLFKTVTETIPAIWAEIKQTALTVIHKIFKEGDLKGAMLEVLRLVFKALGIPFELFTGIFDKGKAAYDLIMEDPGRFLKNVLAAVKQGAIGFADRFLTHLVGGLKDWIFGAVSDKGIKPPADLSMASVLGFVLDVLDVTVEKVLTRLEKKTSKETVAPIRTAIRVMSQVWEWISTLLNEGPGGVWNKLKEKIGDLWGALLAGVSDWLMVKLAKKAAQKLIELAGAPVGAVVTAVLLIYDTAKTIVRYIEPILRIINSVLDMITDIAKGSIAGGAALIETLLEKALGVAIGFLAGMAGLGDIGERIREIIDSIRDKVTEGIDWLLDKALKIGGALLGAVKKVGGKIADWWRSPEPFQTGKDKHSVGFTGEGANLQLVVESTPLILEDYLKTPAAAKLSPSKRAEVLKHKKIVDDLKKTTNFSDADQQTIKKSLTAIAAALGTQLPKTNVTFSTTTVGSYSGEIGMEMVAKPLSLVPGNTTGSEPSGVTDFWKDVNRREGAYVRGHLLNHHVHGPGINKNLVPIPATTNQQMERNFEDGIKEHVLGKAEIVEYTVRAEFKRPKGRKYLPAEDYIPSQLIFAGSVIDAGGNPVSPAIKAFKGTSPLAIVLPQDTPLGLVREHVIIADDPPSKLDTIPGVGPVVAKEIIKFRNKYTLQTYDDLKQVPGLGDEWVEKMKVDPYVKLFSR